MGSVLTQDGFLTEVCASVAECCQKIPRGTGALLLTEEAFEEDKVAPLLEILAAQPPWSDLPMIVLNRPGEARQPGLLRVMGSAAGRLPTSSALHQCQPGAHAAAPMAAL